MSVWVAFAATLTIAKTMKQVLRVNQRLSVSREQGRARESVGRHRDPSCWLQSKYRGITISPACPRAPGPDASYVRMRCFAKFAPIVAIGAVPTNDVYFFFRGTTSMRLP